MSSFLFRSNWNLLWREIWIPLSKSVIAPQDLFIEVYRFAGEKLGLELRLEALNDATLAKEEFRQLPKPTNEKMCIDILEGFYTVLSEFQNGISQQYAARLKKFIELHNLRYILTPRCRLRLSLTGLLISQYHSLKKAISANQERLDCLTELETNIGRLVDDEIEKNCIRIASNFLEGIVVDKTTNQENTLGKAIIGCESCFPHKAVIESVKKFYKFFNDYPNLRHSGSQLNKIRELKKDDAVLSVWFSLMVASFLTNDTLKLISFEEL